MALADFDAFLEKMRGPPRVVFTEGAGGNLAGWWPTFGAGASPGGAAQCDRDTIGIIRDQTTFATKHIFQDDFATPFIAECEAMAGIASAFTSAQNVAFLLYDRLVHTSGMSFTVTIPQTTNLPTPALPRYTTGEGVWAFLQNWVNGTGTPATFEISYTNQAGTPGKTSQQLLGTNTAGGPHRFIGPFCLAAGDTGVRSVESVTVGAGGTGAGDFGVVLIKPLFFVPAVSISVLLNRTPYKNGLFGGSMIEYDPEACLDIATFTNQTSSFSPRFAVRTFDGT